MQPRGATTGRQRYVIALVVAALLVLLISNGTFSRDSVLLFAMLIPSVIVHEVSHGVVALFFGDTTAKDAGRLTLNPVRHIDPFGTIILPAILVLGHAGAFGYAKPVPVRPSQMRHPRNDGFLVAVAGPVTNILLCLLAVLVLRVFFGAELSRLFFLQHLGFGRLEVLPMAAQILFVFGYINVILAAFNLIPIPPLDGSAFLERALPKAWWPGYLRFRQYSMPLLFLVVVLVPGALNRVFNPALNLFDQLLH